MIAHGATRRYDRGPDENNQPGKGCRCPRCRKAHSRRRKRDNLDASQGRSRHVPAEPVRNHVQKLRNTDGADLASIARAAGVTDRVIDHLMYGNPSNNILPALSMRRAHATALLAVQRTDLKPRRVSAVGTQRRLQGLSLAGWPMRVVAGRAGLREDVLSRIMQAAPASKVSPRTAALVKAVCAYLWTRDPVADGVPAAMVARLGTLSTAKGWVSLPAWDAIDDPQATPRGLLPEVEQVRVRCKCGRTLRLLASGHMPDHSQDPARKADDQTCPASGTTPEKRPA